MRATLATRRPVAAGVSLTGRDRRSRGSVPVSAAPRLVGHRLAARPRGHRPRRRRRARRRRHPRRRGPARRGEPETARRGPWAGSGPAGADGLGAGAPRRGRPGRPRRPGGVQRRGARGGRGRVVAGARCTGWCRTGSAPPSTGRRTTPSAAAAARRRRGRPCAALGAAGGRGRARRPRRRALAARGGRPADEPAAPAPPGRPARACPPRCASSPRGACRPLEIVDLALEDDGGAADRSSRSTPGAPRCCPWAAPPAAPSWPRLLPGGLATRPSRPSRRALAVGGLEHPEPLPLGSRKWKPAAAGVARTVPRRPAPPASSTARRLRVEVVGVRPGPGAAPGRAGRRR